MAERAILITYTDGVVESHKRNNGLYGDDRLKSMLNNSRDLPGGQVFEHILGGVNAFDTGLPRLDDITMVVLTRE